MKDNVSCVETIEQRILDYCKRQHLFEKDMCVYVAVSGGADSMALLNILLALAPSLQIRVCACHVNHGMRSEASDRDEAFVRAQCEELAVPLTVFNANADGKKPPVGAGETWARSLRYDYFNRLISQTNTVIATAHTVNDQAETLLFRLARGTGVRGAAAIRPKRGRFVRPFLCLARTEIESYCTKIGQAYVTDETNLLPNYARNHLRQYAIPSLCYANEAAVEHLGQFCEKMAKIDGYFACLANELLVGAYENFDQDETVWSMQETMQIFDKRKDVRFRLAMLETADPLVLSQAVHCLVGLFRDPEQKYVQAICQTIIEKKGSVQVTSMVRFVAKDGCLRITGQTDVATNSMQKVEYYPVLPGKYQFPGGYCLLIEEIPIENMEKIQLVHKKDLKNCADYDKIVASLILRCRERGDTFAPFGRGVTKTVKKLHNELSVPKQERSLLPLLADGHTVVWLWGQGFAQGYAPCKDTKRILKITEENNTEESHNGNNDG